jgi:hypothetical protein
MRAGLMRIAFIIALFAPFAFFGLKDNSFHFRGRRVSVTEHVLHLGIGMTQVMMLVQAIKGNFVLLFIALGLMAIAGSVDEYVFHRDLPPEESDLHAKQHFALFVFVVGAMIVTYLERHAWQAPLSI